SEKVPDGQVVQVLSVVVVPGISMNSSGAHWVWGVQDSVLGDVEKVPDGQVVQVSSAVLDVPGAQSIGCWVGGFCCGSSPQAAVVARMRVARMRERRRVVRCGGMCMGESLGGVLKGV